MLGENLQEIAKVGATAVLYLLIGLSVISIGIVVERWWYYSRRKTDIKRLCDGVGKALRRGDLEAAVNLLKLSKAVEAAAIAEALGFYDEGADSFSEMAEKAIRDRRPNAEAGLLFLGTLGNNAPFIGLFGTVLGIVHSFRELGAAQPGAGGTGNMDNVMNGIAEALISTAVGILVAIPAVVAYNIFSKRAAQIEDNAGALENVVLATLKSEGAVVSTGSSRSAAEDLARVSLPHLGARVEDLGEA